MCGIAGIYHPQGLPDADSVIVRMTRSMIHRGPDQEGYHRDACIRLGSRRLKVIDLSGGRQPLYSDDGRLVIVYNGEVYNFRQLRAELQQKGHRFTTRTDTEVVLNALRQWGVAGLHRLRGMFAAALWDRLRRRLLLVRDRLGIKPLYYAVTADRTVVFASELKALLHYPGVGTGPNVTAFVNLLNCGFNLAPDTFFEGVRQVLPGHYLEATPRGVTQSEYWDVDLQAPCLQAEETTLARGLHAKLAAAVDCGREADVPVAAYLSGGIDSSAVTGLYSRLAPERIRTLSIDFDEADYSETAHARQVAARFGTEHSEFKCRVTAEDIVALGYHLEEPMATLLAMPLFLLSRRASRSGIKVVLSGDGADEVLGGYDYFRLLKAMHFIDRHPGELRARILQRCEGGIRNALQAEIRYMLYSDAPSPHRALPYRYRAFADGHRLFSPEFRQRLLQAPPPAPFFFDVRRIEHRSLLDQALYLECKLRLLNLTLPLADKMSMANSVELRPPFLDHELVEFIFRIPHHYKLRGLEEKYILKRSMEGFLPETICRRRKQPLQPPGKWFVHTAREMIWDYLSEVTVRRKGYFDPAYIARALREHGRASGRDHSGVIIVAFFVHLWDELFLQRAALRDDTPQPPAAFSGDCDAGANATAPRSGRINA